MKTADDYLIQIALDRGLIRPGLVAAARRELAIPAKRDSPITVLTNWLMREGLKDESALIKGVAEECGLPLIV